MYDLFSAVPLHFFFAGHTKQSEADEAGQVTAIINRVINNLWQTGTILGEYSLHRVVD
jgi:hypothetical protein